MCDDDNDEASVMSGKMDIPESKLSLWRDRPDAVRRRKADWAKVKTLTMDLDFSGDDHHYLSFPPLHLVLPSLIDSFGNSVTLQNEDETPLFPNLRHLSERTTTPVETYTAYSAQTAFRFAFYGSYSPKIFSVPQFPNEEARWVQEPAQRFPFTLLSNTKTLSLRDFQDVNDLFPLVSVDVAVPGFPALTPPGGHLHRFTSSPASVVVDEVYLTNEYFAHFLHPDDLSHHIRNSVESVFQQFPNLRTLHLPDPLKFSADSQEEYDGVFVDSFIDAVQQLSRHASPSIRALKVILDQEVWAISPNLSAISISD